MSAKKYVFFVILLSGIIALGGYYYFGGFTEREQELVEVNDYHLVGKHYKGKLNSKELEDIFYEVRSQYEKGEPAGTLTLVTIKEPATGKDTLEQFIGILTESPGATTLPKGWETYTIEAEQAVRNTVRAHNLVMPKPEEVRDEILVFASNKNLNLKPNISIEKYLGERHLEVEIPVE